jgi:hypothetical protein
MPNFGKNSGDIIGGEKEYFQKVIVIDILLMIRKK